MAASEHRVLWSELDEWKGTLDDIFEETGEPNQVDLPTPVDDSNVPLSKVKETLCHCLEDISPAFSFFSAAAKLEKDENRVSKMIQCMSKILDNCVVKTGLITGLRKEKSQQKFFKLASEGFPELVTIAENRNLAMWLATNTFERLADSIFKSYSSVYDLTAPITPEEADIAHYIGGFVISKLKQRSFKDDPLIPLFIEQSEPQEHTLLAAKSRGRLTSLSSRARSMFLEMEQVFRDLFPVGITSVSEQLYINSCCCNEVPVIQDCFFTVTYSVHKNDGKEDLLVRIISLYFKVRVHHRCKTVVDTVRRKNKISGKDRALRSKLSN